MNHLPALKHFSASQINAFKACQRAWWFRAIDKDKQPETPAQQRGKDIHALLEHYLHTGAIQEDKDNGYHRYIEWLAPHLPKPGSEPMAIEQKIHLDVETGLPIPIDVTPLTMFVMGFIDVGLWGREVPTIGDLKTTSDFRYAKTPAELRQDTQMNVYSRWVFGMEPSLSKVNVGHWYVKVSTKTPKTTRAKRVLPVFTDITREENQEHWERDLLVMRDMERAGYVEDGCDLDPNVNHCGRFGGCPYRSRCGIGESLSLFNTQTTRTNTMGFLDQVKKQAGGNGQVAPAAPTTVPNVVQTTPAPSPSPAPSFLSRVKAQESAQAPPTVQEAIVAPPVVEPASTAPEAPPVEAKTTILPPDSAPRTTTEEQGAEIRAEAEEKKEKKTRKPRAVSKGKHKRTFTLYLGCMPTKGEHRDLVMIEDWLVDVFEGLNASAAQNNLVDYRLAGYSEEKVALSMAVQAKIDAGDLPEVLVSIGGDPRVREVAMMLIPKASDVVSAMSYR